LLPGNSPYQYQNIAQHNIHAEAEQEDSLGKVGYDAYVSGEVGTRARLRETHLVSRQIDDLIRVALKKKKVNSSRA
jgi:hypothetical protein